MNKVGSRERRGSKIDGILSELGLPPDAIPLDQVMSFSHERKTRQRGKDGKVMYPSESAAKASARNILSKKSGNVSALRTYFCPECHAWHMSSSFFI